MNEYIEDGVFFLKRASSQLHGSGERETLVDVLLNYALGMERLFKGILHKVNPLFVLEKPDFDSAVKLLYRDQLIGKRKRAVENDLKKAKNQDAKVHAFSASLSHAVQFSETLDSYRGAMTQLCEYRGILAHRTIAELDAKEVWRFMRKTFPPVVAGVAGELGIEPSRFYETTRLMQALSNWSAEITKEDATEEKVAGLIESCQKLWDAKKNEASYVAAAEARTQESLEKDRSYRPRYWTDCPACGQRAVLEATVDGEYEEGEFTPTGIDVNRLECHFCGMKVEDYEEVDHLELYGRLDQSQRGGKPLRS